MTLRHLEIFIQVYELQSMTKASQKMHLAQPSISLAIKELENYYNIVLFDRMNRRLYPTSADDRFYQYAVHIISLFNELEENMQDFEKSGTIRIGSSITISNYFLPDILLRFKQEEPDLAYQIEVHNAFTIEKEILENKIDFALIETKSNNENIVYRPFYTDELVTVVSVGHPLTKKNNVSLEDLLEYPFFMREEGSSVRTLVESVFTSHQIDIIPAMDSSSTQAIIKCVEASLGVSTLPYLLVKQAIEEGRLATIKVNDMHIERTYHLIYHKNKYISPMIEKLFELCLEYGKEKKKEA